MSRLAEPAPVSGGAAAAAVRRPASHGWLALVLAVALILSLLSISIGAGDFSFAGLLAGTDTQAWQLFAVSRLPRTVALLLAGMALAVAGLIMQMLVRNRFVEPSTAGTIESATLGILVVMLLAVWSGAIPCSRSLTTSSSATRRA